LTVVALRRVARLALSVRPLGPVASHAHARAHTQVPEILFNPSLASLYDGLTVPSGAHALHDLTLESINRCDVDVRKELYSGVVLTGGWCARSCTRVRMHARNTRTRVVDLIRVHSHAHTHTHARGGALKRLGCTLVGPDRINYARAHTR
jgi:hypothetical protein